MLATSLSVFEHADIPVAPNAGPGVLSEAEAEHLCWIGEQCGGFCARGFRSLKLAQFCGLVNLGDRVLEILPKAGEQLSYAQSRRVLLRLLRMSPDFPLHQQSPAGQSHCAGPLLDVFIRAFFDEIASLMKGGLLRRYLELEEDCLAVRGAIMSARQFTVLANRTDYIACRFDELTADNRWNRLIKAGLRVVRPWMHGVDLQRSWVELMNGFDEVSDVGEPRSLLSDLRYDRQGSRYRPAIEWVQRILSLLSPDLRAGERPAPGLLFDMNRLFEATVEQRMQTWAAQKGWQVEGQNTSRHLGEIVDTPKRKAFGVRPDLLFRHQGQIIGVADAKWKHPALSRRGFVLPDQADLYQLHAYASIFRCDHLALIYPWDESLVDARETKIELPRTGYNESTVSILCLDVAQDALPFRLKSDQWPA